MRELEAAGKAALRHRAGDAGVGVGQPVDQAIFALEMPAGMVEDPPAGAAHLVALVSGGDLGQPFRLGDAVIVDEGDDVARRHADADIARHRQVGRRAAPDADLGQPALDQGLGAVGRGTVDDDHLERTPIGLPAEAVQRVAEAFFPVERVDHDRDAGKGGHGLSPGGVRERPAGPARHPRRGAACVS